MGVGRSIWPSEKPFGEKPIDDSEEPIDDTPVSAGVTDPRFVNVTIERRVWIDEPPVSEKRSGRELGFILLSQQGSGKSTALKRESGTVNVYSTYKHCKPDGRISAGMHA